MAALFKSVDSVARLGAPSYPFTSMWLPILIPPPRTIFLPSRRDMGDNPLCIRKREISYRTCCTFVEAKKPILNVSATVASIPESRLDSQSPSSSGFSSRDKSKALENLQSQDVDEKINPNSNSTFQRQLSLILIVHPVFLML